MGKSFGAFLGNPYKQLFYHFLFMAMTMGIVIMGVSKGIERATKILMPVLFGLILLLVFYAASVGAFGKSLSFLFVPDFSKVTGHGILEAVGHAFFTLSLGMGAMLTYGSYMRKDDPIIQPAFAISFLDTLVALLACLMIYPIIFGGFGLKTGGVGILFTSLPVVFVKMPMGAVVAPIFFLLVAFAALSSTISLLEVVVAYGVDEHGWHRERSTLVLGGAIFLFGVPSALCNGGVGWISKITLLSKGGKALNWFDSFDYLASNWLLPIGGLLTALFVGWVMDKQLQEAQQTGDKWQPLIGVSRFFLRFVSPVAVFVVLLNKIGLLELKPAPKPGPKARKAAHVRKVPTRRAVKEAAPAVRARANKANKKAARPMPPRR